MFAFAAFVWVAPLPPQLPVRMFGIVALVLPEWVAPNPPAKPALKPEFDWVVCCKPAELPEFCCPPPTPRGANVTFGYILPTLRPMAAMGVPLGDVVIALAFAAAVAAAIAATCVLPRDKFMALMFTATAAAAATLTFGGGWVGVRNIVALLGESWV